MLYRETLIEEIQFCDSQLDKVDMEQLFESGKVVLHEITAKERVVCIYLTKAYPQIVSKNK